MTASSEAAPIAEALSTPNLKPHSVKTTEFKWKFHWMNLILLTSFHVFGLHGLYYLVTNQLDWKTLLFGIILMILTSLGVTTGAHRLWAHRSYKAKTHLRVLLCIFFTLSLQESLWKWVRNHRLHHKYSDTDADPHNPARGFFFAHVGWLLVQKHPEVFVKSKKLDFSDMRADPIVMYQHKYYYIFASMAIFLPAVVPWYFWNEDFYISFTTVSMFKVAIILNFTWLVNSAAHRWGMRPYDKTLTSSDNKLVNKLTLGEGWHNFHHVFPWDYRGMEVDRYSGALNTSFIELMSRWGWAYDLKSPSVEMIKARILRSGEQAPKGY